MTLYKLQRNLEIPPRGSKLSQTLHVMKVGDSFIYDGTNTAAHTAARRIGIAITTRKESNGVRIWRTK